MIKTRKKNYLNKIVILAIVSLLLLSLGGCGKTTSDVIAKVNDEVITKDDLFNILVTQGGEEILDTMINEIIINSEIKKLGLDVTEDDVQEELNKMIDAYGGEASFMELMSYYNYKVEDIKKNIDMNLKIKRLLSPRLEISDSQVEEYFEDHKDEFGTMEEVLASHILVEEEDLANEIYEKLIGGQDFEELAMEYSIDGSAANGGDLGYFARGDMVQSFEDKAFSLAIDEIGKPVQSQFGYHIIKVYDKIEAEDAKLDDHVETIKDRILEENMADLYDSWYEEIIDNYKIEKNLGN